MGKDNCFDKGQAEAKTTRGATLDSRLENIRHNLWREARTVILNEKPR